MGAGRPPKSKETHIKDGTYRKIDHEDRGYKVNPVSGIEIPEDITEEKTIRTWKMIVPALCEKGLISITEVPIIEYAFKCYQDAMKCEEAINLLGGTISYLQTLNYKDKDLTKYRKENMTEFNNLMFKFGITPAENPKVRQSQKKDDNDVSDLLGLRGRL